MLTHDKLEKSNTLLSIVMTLVMLIGGAVEIIPLFYLKSAVKPVEGVRPYTPLELEGRDIYIREGCYNCHSQMIRPLKDEYDRYGHYSVAAESMYDFPFQWGSKRTGPDLARVGGLYTDEWHKIHLKNPKSLVPESVMPAYPWLEKTILDISLTKKKIAAMKKLGVPYGNYEVDMESLKNKTELDALIAYIQVLGTMAKFGVF
jgi:cytochrome c oxidase cbb3-type subunit 2